MTISRDQTDSLRLSYTKRWASKRGSRKRGGRNGATLLEVLLATGLFAMGMAALLPLMQGGTRAAMRAELEAMAASRCESALASYLANRNRAEAGDGMQQEGDGDWNVRIETVAHSSGLQQLTIVAASRLAPEIGRFELTCLIPQAFEQPGQTSDMQAGDVLNE